MENKLARRINLLESLRVDMESKYGATDAIVLELAQEIKSLQAKISEKRKQQNARSLTIAENNQA